MLKTSLIVYKVEGINGRLTKTYRLAATIQIISKTNSRNTEASLQIYTNEFKLNKNNTNGNKNCTKIFTRGKSNNRKDPPHSPANKKVKYCK